MLIPYLPFMRMEAGVEMEYLFVQVLQPLYLSFQRLGYESKIMGVWLDHLHLLRFRCRKEQGLC